ncbi:MAG: heme-copper oxidase subunit III, partial [Verrucomicrobia bacterium]|nr:heme-copper oxidase subunit III [Verrucomicrobiota bacterium]
MQSSSIAADAPGSLPHSPAAAPSSHFHAAKINLPRFGMFTFLASEAMLFAGLICAYLVLRSSLGHNYRPEEAPMLPWKLTGINTIILLSSSFTCWLAERQVVRNIRPTLWLFATATLGAIFVSIQGVEWTNLYHEHMWFNKAGEGMPNGHVYSSVFFTLTGFHGAHVAIGVIMLFFCTAFSFFGKFSAHHHTLLECTSLYWHFVDVVW